APVSVIFFVLSRCPPCSTLFPSTTLFRSQARESRAGGHVEAASGDGRPALRVSPAGAEPVADGRDHRLAVAGGGACGPADRADRSEEHTSELQSLTNLVCRLLLENKNYAS